MTIEQNSVLLEVNNLKMHFPVSESIFSKSKTVLKAVDGVSFTINRGETFGLVGESGSVKTTTGKCILGIHNPTDGNIIYNGIDITKLSKNEAKKFLREKQMIFQDPYGSLDPRRSAFTIVKDAIVADGHKIPKGELKDKVNSLLELVELDPVIGTRYPHEMSGGQRQRLGIARALACDPKLIVCDEPVSALDVSIQAQIINLFEELQEKMKLTYLFIAHDLAVVRHISDYVGVTYLGKLVEVTDSRELYKNPLHPYTKALLSAIPLTNYEVERKRNRIMLQGDIPSPINTPTGCPFHPRCIYARKECLTCMPPLREISKGHKVACHIVN
ncbi:MAG: ABC transporter ATP-binding protein [Clostridiaceae bacterium]|nr:ABC transporter ATP-binding protein [Clostridiaceae bacterium]